MATVKDLPQIEVQAIAADMEQICDEKEEGSHLSINYVSCKNDEPCNTSQRDNLGKLSIARRIHTKVRSKFNNHPCCLWSSKAVILILVWNLIISIGFKSFFDPSLYTNIILKRDFDNL